MLRDLLEAFLKNADCAQRKTRILQKTVQNPSKQHNESLERVRAFNISLGVVGECQETSWKVFV